MRSLRRALSHQPFLLTDTCARVWVRVNKISQLATTSEAGKRPLLARCDGVDGARTGIWLN